MKTTSKGIPYAEATDLRRDWPGVSAQVATYIDDNLPAKVRAGRVTVDCSGLAANGGKAAGTIAGVNATTDRVSVTVTGIPGAAVQVVAKCNTAGAIYVYNLGTAAIAAATSITVDWIVVTSASA
jgi:hypothetical protein